jgi:hypothetical protein
MTIDDLITEARQDFLNDNVAPYLWSKEQLERFANEAILEACSRAPLLIRVRTVSVVDGTAEYAINEFTRQIQLAKLSLQTDPLIQTTDAKLSIFRGVHWRELEGTPTHYVRKGHSITLYPKPIVNDTLSLVTTNIPDDDFDFDADIDSAYHKGLVFWMAYKAFMFPDADTYNPVKANDFLVQFEAKFGKRKSAKYDSVAFDSPMYGTISAGRMC